MSAFSVSFIYTRYYYSLPYFH